MNFGLTSQLRRAGLLWAGLALAAAVTGCRVQTGVPFVSGSVAGGPGGTALSSATVTLVDQSGNRRSATTGSDGSYSIDAYTLNPPFLLQAVSADGNTTLYGFAVNGVFIGDPPVQNNINPYTDLLVRAYFDAQGTTASATFSGLGPAAQLLLPNPATVTTLQKVLNEVLRAALDAEAVANGSSFNVFSTPFVAGTSGFGALLQATSTPFTMTGNGSYAFSIAVGTSLSESFNLTAANGELSFDWNSTSNGTTLSHLATASCGPSSAQGQAGENAAVTAVGRVWTSLAALATQKQGALAAADIAPYVDANYLDRGVTASAYEQNLATQLGQLAGGSNGQAGNSLSLSAVSKVYAYNPAGGPGGRGLITVQADLQVQPPAGNSHLQSLGALYQVNDGRPGLVFAQESDGSYRLYGDQTPAAISLYFEPSALYAATGDSTGLFMVLQGQVPFTTLPSPTDLSGATAVSGISVGNSGSNTLLPDCSAKPPYALTAAGPISLAAQANSSSGQADVANGSAIFSDAACSSIPLPSLPASLVGVTYPVTMTSSGSAQPVQINAQILGADSEQLQLLSIGGQSPSAFLAGATLADYRGQALTITWQPPQSFPLESVVITTTAEDGSGNSSAFDTAEIPGSVTSGQSIPIPLALSPPGGSTASADIRVTFFSVNGDRIAAEFVLQ